VREGAASVCQMVLLAQRSLAAEHRGGCDSERGENPEHGAEDYGPECDFEEANHVTAPCDCHRLCNIVVVPLSYMQKTGQASARGLIREAQSSVEPLQLLAESGSGKLLVADGMGTRREHLLLGTSRIAGRNIYPARSVL
jgi:hypothetical protein